MIDIQHGALRAFEHHALPGGDGIVQQAGGIADHRADALRQLLSIRRARPLASRSSSMPKARAAAWCSATSVSNSGSNISRSIRSRDADAAPRDLVFIAGADAARGGADGNAAGPRFAQFLHQAMGGQQHLRAVADEQIALHRQAGGFQHFDFSSSAAGSTTRPLPITAFLPGPQDAAGDQLQHELAVADAHGVPGVMPALVAGHDIEAFGEKVDDFPLPSSPHCAPRMITLLRSHDGQTHSFYRM